jgi:hypothetical protein
MRTVRVGVTLIAVVLATLLLSNYLQEFWVRAFVDNPEATSGWWSPRWLGLTWGWDTLVTLVAALGLALLLPRGSSIWWYVGLGVVYALIRLIAQGGFQGLSTDLGFSFWHYGSYVMSVIGATLGGGVAIGLGAWRRRLTIVGGVRESR